MTYSVLAAHDNNLLTGSKFTDYAKEIHDEPQAEE